MAREQLKTPEIAWHSFATGAVLADALAAAVAGQLAQAVERRGVGFLAVSGGTTPKLFFQRLSGADIDWSRVTVTLVDERFVDRDSPRANAGLVRENLLQDKAASAIFVDLYLPARDVEAAALELETQLAPLPWPLDVVVLGMGSDGHTASYFPDAEARELPLDPASKAIVYPVHAKSAGEPRLTLALARLAEADFVALHIEGAEKRSVLEAAMAGPKKPPVRTVLDHTLNPVQVFWAP